MVHRSRFPDVELPDVALPDFVIGGAAARGDAPALIDGTTGAVTTYAELADRVRSAAGALAAAGLGRGDTLALLSPNLPAWPVTLYAALSLGAVVTPLNPLQTYPPSSRSSCATRVRGSSSPPRRCSSRHRRPPTSPGAPGCSRSTR